MPAPLDFPPNTAHPAAPVGGDKWPDPPVPNQPIYTYDGEKWTTGDPLTSGGTIGASTTLPLANGTASAGTQGAWSRGDHVHPTGTMLRAELDEIKQSIVQLRKDAGL